MGSGTPMTMIEESGRKAPNLNKGVIKPIVCAFRVLEDIARMGEGRTLSSLSATTGLSKTTVYRYVRTLEYLGYVLYERKIGGYFLGPSVWNIISEDTSEHTLTAAASGAMQWLHKTFDETVNLGRGKGRRILYLKAIKTSRPSGMRAGQGDADCFHCTALGKAVLSAVPEDQVGDFLNEPLQQFTPHTIVDREILFRELNEVRRRGYAVDLEETELGHVCFGAPIIDQNGSPIAALSVSVPVARLTDQLRLEIPDAVARASSIVSKRLNNAAMLARVELLRPSRRGHSRLPPDQGSRGDRSADDDRL
jgi:DNA-binding IclR family transcriptional regulator